MNGQCSIVWERPAEVVERLYLFPLGKVWYVPLQMKRSKVWLKFVKMELAQPASP